MPLSVQDVGYRVVVRRIAGQRGGRPLYSDLLGELVAWGDVVVVRTADGEVAVPRAEVAAAKRIPPKRERRTTAPAARHLTISDLELERIAALGWRGLRTERLGGWLLRASGGWTGRANSVLPLGEPGVELDDALGQVERWYAEAGLTAMIQVPLPAKALLREALLERGWADAWGALVMTGSIPEVLAGLATRPDLPEVHFAEAPSAAWLAAYHYRGGSLPEAAVEVLRSGDQPVFVSVSQGGNTVAIARAALDEGWLGVTAVEVDAAQRRRGLATHLLRGVLEYGLARGAHSSYLQTESTNTAARTLYEGVGYGVHHTYRYLRAPERPGRP